MKQHALTLGIAALLGTLPLGALAEEERREQQPQGLYSADDILDADVVLSDNLDDEVGEVEDILLDEAMQVKALVIESDSVLGLGGRKIVVEAGRFNLHSDEEADGDTRHRVELTGSPEELENYPEYDDDWWQRARDRSREAWSQAQEGAQSAWQSTREGAEQVWETTRENARQAWEAVIEE